MNNINLTGRITKDLELRATNSGKSVVSFDLAVNRIGSETTDFINCAVFGVQADNLHKYQGKGSMIGLTGSLRVDKYQDKDGNNKYRTYVLANNIEYLSSKKEESGQSQTSTSSYSSVSSDEIVLTDDDLPF